MATSQRIRETAGRSTGSRPPFGVSWTAVLITLGTLIPLGFVVTVTATTGWETAVELIVRPRVGELLFNTIALVVLTVPACIVLGVAYLAFRHWRRGRGTPEPAQRPEAPEPEPVGDRTAV